MKTALFSQHQPGGMFSVVNNEITTGSIFWVDSNTGTDGSGYGRNPDAPVATIDYAIGLCTANKGDVIFVMPQHAETITAAITLDVAGVSVIGLGHGRNKPVITGNGTIDAMTVTAADVTIKGLVFAAPETDAQTADINVAAGTCSIIDTIHIGSKTSNNKVDIITLEAAANDCLIDGVRIYNSVVECVGGIKLEGACARVEIRNCFVMDSIGFTNGAIYDAATATHVFIHNNVFSNAKADTVVAEFGNNTTGVCSSNMINGRNSTIAANWTLSTGMAYFENYVVEEVQKSGLLLPAVDSD